MTRLKGIISFVIFAYAVVIPVIALFLLLKYAPPNQSFAETAAVFSDLLTPTFAVLAFGGLIYTAVLQSEGLGLTRQDQKDSRADLEKAADANQKTAAALLEQAEIARYTARVNALKEVLAYLEGKEQEFIRENIAADNGLTLTQIQGQKIAVYKTLFTILETYTIPEELEKDLKAKEL